MDAVSKESKAMVEELLRKYYSSDSKAYKILLIHSMKVAEMALKIAEGHPELQLDKGFLYESAMLHDIGVFACDAPSIGCYGVEPYIKHGLIGSELLTKEGLPLHGLVCERHTGVGLTLEAIKRRNLPLPHREMVPVSMAEKVVCFADCFYSKSGDPTEKKSIKQVAKGLAKHGEEHVKTFYDWCALFM